MDSYDHYSLKNKGITFVKRGLYKEAIEWFDRALQIKPDDCNSLRDKGTSLVWLERYKEAIECYDLALKINLNDYESLRSKGIALFLLGKYEEAIKCYDRALKIKPDDYDSFREKGVALSSMGMHKEAIKCYNRALKIKPNDCNSLREKGVALVWLKRYREAIECYDLALKFKPDDFEVLKGKGVALGSLGIYKEAIESLDKALKIKPNDDLCLKYKDNVSEKMRGEYVNKSKQDNIKYDVALSFAGENREIVEQIATKLAENNIQVFYDEFEKAKIWGKRLSTHLQKTYGENTSFVVVFVSKEYSLKDWTNFEFSIARGESKVRETEFILPVRLDNTTLFGLPDDVAYLDFNIEGIEGIVSAIIDKLKY